MFERFQRVEASDRSSYLSSVNNDGALRDGGAPSLFSTESCGLLAQYAAVGLMMGALPSAVTPFLGYYLNMEGQVTTSARALLGIPWSVKVFIGIVSDCFPLCGFRRRPFMIIGWMLCTICLVAMATFPLDKPYFPNASWRKIKPSDYTADEVSAINYHAPSTGGKYVVFMMLATLGYVIADVAADGVVVEYAQREPIAIRGRTQTAIYTVRSIFSIFGSVLVGFGLSSPPYGGDFSFGVSFPVCILILAICCVPVVPVTWYFVKEKQVTRPDLRQYMGVLWESLQSRAVYQVIAYSFFSGVFGGISYVASDPVTMYWARATSFNISVSQVIGSGVTAVTLALMGRYGLDWDWRRVVVITTIAVVALDAVCTMLTTWAVVRNQWFWLGLPIVETIPSSVNFIVSSFVVVELADEGNEAAIYGLLTTVGNLSNPFSATVTKAINEPFAVSNRDILNDSHATRRDVTIVVLISYASKLLSLSFLVWLPRQKAETQRLKQSGSRSRLLGGVTIAYCLFALTWSLLINLLGIFESTRCLKIVGGC
ncbi:Folate-Biopterin Transporter (FBT) Family [Phytophthora infestans T30-4]|uniref:Folate-Biopterin Transporter (FBT) Family n=1 Tax=Phytophthora infestans (strain T30-4) TaxID=403677 RepID=D0NNJ2_PHYIT|nr:Folate-Biopterin Transporter (FBT) Family [Phytophthora infestans T30-4]EEY62163.1 Folate-Biopterin Transporter (FBT) Family [Phytophthora infestans T30-4]|eukprot:XP_002899194.1 Folate-Biopterin Transporter (FBT) Family [Phytophthora infestans T30-4]